VIEKLVEIVFNAYEAFTVAVFLKEGDGLRCRSSLTFSQHFERHKVLSLEGTLPGLVLKHGEALIMPSFDRDEGVLGYYSQREGIKAFIGCPVAEKGVLVIDSKKRWSFSEKEKRMLPTISSLLCELMEGEKRLSEMEEALEDARKGREILRLFDTDCSVEQVLTQACELIRADLSFVAIEKGGDLLVDEVYPETARPFKGRKCLKGGIAYETFRRGAELILPFESSYLRARPVFFEGDGLLPRQLFLFPLKKKEALIGILGVLSQSGPLREQGIEWLREIALILSFYYMSSLSEQYTRKIGSLDALTGMLQFAPFLSKLRDMVRERRAFTLVSVSIKGLGQLNRILGLEGTNDLLRRVSGLIRHHFGEGTTACRKSGGHFYVLLKERRDLPSRLEALKMNLTRLMEREGLGSEGNIECGFSLFPDDAEEVFDLLERSEKMLKGG
jgi:GGDEF domain-containing protein